jgi:hypothetical protein
VCVVKEREEDKRREEKRRQMELNKILNQPILTFQT